MPKGYKGPPGMPMPPGMGGGLGSGAKSELPADYAASDKTPFTVNVPTDGPVKLDLQSAAKGKK